MSRRKAAPVANPPQASRPSRASRESTEVQEKFERPPVTIGKKRFGAVPGMRYGGRVKGTPNRMTVEVKDMVRRALDEAGGVAYLVQQARDNPKAFLVLVAKLMPTQVSGPNGQPIPLRIDPTKLEDNTLAQLLNAVTYDHDTQRILENDEEADET